MCQVYALTTHQLQVERRGESRDNQGMRSRTQPGDRGERDIESQSSVCAHPNQPTGERRESLGNQVYALTTLTATGGEERES